MGEVQLIVFRQVVFFAQGSELFCCPLVALDEAGGQVMARTANVANIFLGRGIGVDYLCNGVSPRGRDA